MCIGLRDVCNLELLEPGSSAVGGGSLSVCLQAYIVHARSTEGGVVMASIKPRVIIESGSFGGAKVGVHRQNQNLHP